MLHADAQALDDGGDDGRIDADVAESDEVVGLFGQLALCGPAVADADDPIVARQPGELKQNAAELSEGVLLGFDPFPVLDVSETGIQQVDHLHEEHAPTVQIRRGRCVRRRGGRLPRARDSLQAVAQFLQKFGSGFVHALLKAAGRASPGGIDSSIDDFVKSPTSALRFISLSLRRTISTPRDTRLARLEFGTFYKVVCQSTLYEPIINIISDHGLEVKVRG